MAELVKLILFILFMQQNANNKNSFILPYSKCEGTLTSVKRLYKNSLTTILNSESHCEILEALLYSGYCLCCFQNNQRTL
jgi:hypothetical protein